MASQCQQNGDKVFRKSESCEVDAGLCLSAVLERPVPCLGRDLGGVQEGLSIQSIVRSNVFIRDEQRRVPGFLFCPRFSKGKSRAVRLFLSLLGLQRYTGAEITLYHVPSQRARKNGHGR